MNVGEWLKMQLKPKYDSGAYIRDGLEMMEIAPHCYLNIEASKAGLGQAKARVKGVAINVPIGNSLTPWREWLSEHEGWAPRRSWK